MSKLALAYTSRADLPELPERPTQSPKKGDRTSNFPGWSQRHNINIGLNFTVKVARTRSPRERNAILWLANYLHREQRTADQLTELLGAPREDIRAALTNPEADIRHTVQKIESLRAVMDANLRLPANTAFFRRVEKTARFAMEKGALTEVIKKTRTGKTTTADYIHLKNLDRSLYYECTDGESFSDFIFDFARAVGISVGNGKTTSQIKAQIRALFGRNAINLLIIDEGHKLWPSDITLKPRRIEFLRSLWDRNKRQLAIVILSTPQAIVSANQALGSSKRWAPGQWEGRIVRFHGEEVTSDEDHESVVRWHFPEGTPAMIDLLVKFVKISPGFYGALENVIDLARFEAADSKMPMTISVIREAIQESIKKTPLEQELKKAGIVL